jgi:hypothetical protein
MAHDAVVDPQDAGHLVERAGIAGEVQEVVAPVGLVPDLVRELAPSPDVVQVPGAAAGLDLLTRTRDDLRLAVVLQVGVEQQQNLVFVHVPVLLPSV